jgi:hypothetical protein
MRESTLSSFTGDSEPPPGGQHILTVHTPLPLDLFSEVTTAIDHVFRRTDRRGYLVGSENGDARIILLVKTETPAAESGLFVPLGKPTEPKKE